MTQRLIEVHDLSIGYADKVVGQALNLHLHRKQIVCLLGPNGSGKSTLFKTLLGLLPAKAGHISILGKPLQDWSARQLARQVAYVPQAQDTALPLSVEDIILLGRATHIPLFSAPSDTDRQVAYACLDTLGMAHLYARTYHQLSGGEKQMVLIARALAQAPAALIMDEPTASLDFGNQIRVLKQMRRLANNGMAILFCTHQPEHARQIADQVALYRDGRIQSLGDPDHMLTAKRMAWLYDLDESDLAGAFDNTPARPTLTALSAP